MTCEYPLRTFLNQSQCNCALGNEPLGETSTIADAVPYVSMLHT